MGVQLRVTFAAGAVVEADRQQPLSGHVLVSTVATARPKMGVQVGDRLSYAGMVGRQDRLANGRIAQPVEDRHTLRRAQDHIKGGHRVVAVGPAEELPGCGVAALEHGLEPGHRCFALQPEVGGAGAVPAARTLAVAGQVLFVVGGQLAGVVLLPPHRELGDVGHHPAAPSPRLSWRQQRTRGALLLG